MELDPKANFELSKDNEVKKEYRDYFFKKEIVKIIYLLDDEMNRDLIKFEKNFGSPKNVISIHITKTIQITILIIQVLMRMIPVKIELVYFKGLIMTR